MAVGGGGGRHVHIWACEVGEKATQTGEWICNRNHACCSSSCPCGLDRDKSLNIYIIYTWFIQKEWSAQWSPSNKATSSAKNSCPYYRGVLWWEGAPHAFTVLAAKTYVRYQVYRGVSVLECPLTKGTVVIPNAILSQIYVILVYINLFLFLYPSACKIHVGPMQAKNKEGNLNW